MHRPPAVGEGVAAGTRIDAHVHRRALEVVAHHVGHILDADLARRLDEEGHLALQVVAHRIVQPVRSGRGDLLSGLVEVGELPVAKNVEGAPGPGVAGPRTAEVQGIVRVAEGEFSVLAGEVPHLAGEGDDIRRIEAVLGVIQREARDPGLVGVGADVAVGDAARHPDDALLFLALADEIHHPDLVGVGDGETLALGRIAVLVGQGRDGLDGFARRPGPLQRDIDQGSVVHDAVRVRELLAPAVGRLADDELVLVHVAEGLVGISDLRDFAEGLVGIPFRDLERGAGHPFGRLAEIEFSEEPVGVRGIGDHAGAVLAGAFGDQHVRAGIGFAGKGQRRQDQQDAEEGFSSHFVVLSLFD